jgi:hypothetical protein
MSKISKKERDEAIARLHEWLKPGDTIYTILRHVSRSGMTRTIDVVQIRPDGGMRALAYNVAIAVGYPLDSNREGLRVQGCGSDMGFEVVYNLGRALFPEGFKLAKDQHGRNGDKSGFDNDGGYALKQIWL